MKINDVTVKVNEKLTNIRNSPYFKPALTTLAVIGTGVIAYLLYENHSLKDDNDYLNNKYDSLTNDFDSLNDYLNDNLENLDYLNDENNCLKETVSSLFNKCADQKDTINKLASDALRCGSSLGGTEMNKIKQEKIPM